MPLCLQSIVICLIISSKHWSNSSYLTGQRPIYLAWRLSNLFYSSSCNWITSIFVAGVDRTVCTQSCPLSVRCYLGGRIYPKISSVWCGYYYLFLFFLLVVLALELTRTGVEYLTRDSLNMRQSREEDDNETFE